MNPAEYLAEKSKNVLIDTLIMATEKCHEQKRKIEELEGKFKELHTIGEARDWLQTNSKLGWAWINGVKVQADLRELFSRPALINELSVRTYGWRIWVDEHGLNMDAYR